MMIFGKQDWTKNYFAAIGAEDHRTGNAVLIDAIAKEVAFNKDAVIGVIESSDIEIKHNASQGTINKILQDNLGSNKKLANNLTKLLLREKYHNSVGEIMDEAPETEGKNKGDYATQSDIAKKQVSGEVLSGMIGSLFRSSNSKKSDEKASEARIAIEKKQQNNKQLDDRVSLYTGATEAAEKNRKVGKTLLIITILGIGGFFLYKKYWK